MLKATAVTGINVTQKKEDSNLQIIFSSGRRKAKIDVLGNPILIECTSCKQMLPLCKFGKSSKAWFNHKEKCINCLKLKKINILILLQKNTMN